ncbi:type II secretion system F family protein [Salmonella enterica]|nr:type II secretion system F family protein [Salmonella enterica]
MFDISSVFTPFRSLLNPVSRGWRQAEIWLGRKTFNAGDRLMIYEDLAFLLDNSVKLEDAVKGMMENRREGTLRPRASVYCLQEVALALKQGKPLDVGLRRWIPRNEAAIIQSGIKEKRLADSLRRAIHLVLAVRDIRSTLLERLIQPLVLFFSLVALACMMSWSFLPQMETLKPREQWQGSLVWMAVISDAFGQHLSLWIIGTLLVLRQPDQPCTSVHGCPSPLVCLPGSSGGHIPAQLRRPLPRAGQKRRCAEPAESAWFPLVTSATQCGQPSDEKRELSWPGVSGQRLPVSVPGCHQPAETADAGRWRGSHY